MTESECIIYIGKKFTIEWYFDKNGKSAVYEYFIEAPEDLQDKFLILAKKMGDFGKIFDIKKFRNEGDGIYAFKPQPDRYLSFFTDGKKIIVTNGFRKKTDKLPKNEKALALKYRQDYLERKSGGKK
ncbi:MAG: type II toxin-antitoxin system RelE/ParE family toxin [Spirochaetes bacterium]|nr:type II toxin-antitoxin system RelE/ParE family toxin [Spirochaetota bacterium]